jgi:hypothetical protein
MPSMTGGVGAQMAADVSRARSADCAYLHSAFGPGCPYCRHAAYAAPDGPAGSRVHERPPIGPAAAWRTT